ncbi:MAG: hypothetical protein M9894_24100 [Planctomycetes bacterium]|nr:hypothetical protein [Planctomycetota bacterium]
METRAYVLVGCVALVVLLTVYCYAELWSLARSRAPHDDRLAADLAARGVPEDVTRACVEFLQPRLAWRGFPLRAADTMTGTFRLEDEYAAELVDELAALLGRRPAADLESLTLGALIERLHACPRAEDQPSASASR